MTRLRAIYRRGSLPRGTSGALSGWAALEPRVDVGRGNIVGQDIAETDAFTVISLNGSYRLNDALRLSTGVDNRFDETYAEHLSRAGAMVSGYLQTERVNEAGRLWWLKVDLTPYQIAPAR